MIGQVTAGIVLLAIGCNVITGVGDLKVANGCDPDAGAACDTGLTTESMPLDPPPTDAGETGGGDAGGGSGNDPPRRMTTCAAGSVQACAGAGRCAGAQTCLADGSGYSSCVCAPLGIRGSIAAACATNADCAAGLTCTTSSDVGGPFSNGEAPGGPQNGYCSRSCNTDAECQAADPDAICLGPGNGSSHCFTSCDVTAPSFPAQCNGRDDLTCIALSLDTPRAYCAPACQDDEGCAPRFCNLATGLCQDERHTGKPIGAGCSSNDDCASAVCTGRRGQPPACTGLCTFESPAGCGFATDAPERDAACVDTALGGGFGPGLCSELCDEDSDCEQQADGATCTPWSIDVIVAYAEAFQRVGFCEFAPGDAGIDFADGAGKCTEECLFTDDGDCDDGGPGSQTDICLPGTDCTDCGAR